MDGPILPAYHGHVLATNWTFFLLAEDSEPGGALGAHGMVAQPHGEDLDGVEANGTGGAVLLLVHVATISCSSSSIGHEPPLHACFSRSFWILRRQFVLSALAVCLFGTRIPSSCSSSSSASVLFRTHNFQNLPKVVKRLKISESDIRCVCDHRMSYV